MAASVSYWYFNQTNDTQGRGSVFRGLFTILVFHLGSIALGSAIITTCQLIRALLEQYRRLVGHLDPKNICTKLIILSTCSLFFVSEFITKHITKNAYA